MKKLIEHCHSLWKKDPFCSLDLKSILKPIRFWDVGKGFVVVVFQWPLFNYKGNYKTWWLFSKKGPLIRYTIPEQHFEQSLFLRFGSKVSCGDVLMASFQIQIIFEKRPLYSFDSTWKTFRTNMFFEIWE